MWRGQEPACRRAPRVFSADGNGEQEFYCTQRSVSARETRNEINKVKAKSSKLNA